MAFRYGSEGPGPAWTAIPRSGAPGCRAGPLRSSPIPARAWPSHRPPARFAVRQDSGDRRRPPAPTISGAA